MKNIILLLFLLINCVAIQKTYAQEDETQTEDLIDYSLPQAYEIGGISITGIKYLDEDALVTLSGLEVGQKINVPGDDIPKALKSLWKQGLFADVKIKASKIINDVIFLEIALVERVRLSKYTFNGVKKSEEEDLRESIGLLRGRVINENMLSNTKNAIKKFYVKKGFLNTTVSISQENDPVFKNSSILTLNVDRGNKIRINEIIVNGNKEVFSRSLKKQMKDTREKTAFRLDAPKTVLRDLRKANLGRTFGDLSLIEAAQYIDENIVRLRPFTSSKFIEDDYEADKIKAIAYYNEKGYRDARVISDSIYLVDDKSINIVMNVEEGKRYYFRDIVWKGNTKYEDDYLSRVLGIKKGDIYNRSLMEMRLFMDQMGNDVSSLYMDDGYLFFNVTPVEKAVEDDSIDLVINVYEGPQATINKVIIKGNTKTNEHVIRRELRSLPGTKFSRSDIIRSQREIATLNFFDPEQIGINPIPNPSDGTVDIEYSVVEKPSDQLELSAGWGGSTVVGSVGVSFNNFSLRNITKLDSWQPLPSGDGQKLSLRFQSTGRAFQSVNASFTEPWLGGKRPNALTLSVFTSRIFRNFFTNPEPEDRQLQYITGASIGLGRRLQWPDDNFSMQVNLNYDHYRLQNSTSDFIISDGTSNNLSLTTTIARYSLDQPIYPRSGSNLSLSLQITPAYSNWFNPTKDYSDLPNEQKYKWAEYHKWKFKAEWYTAIVGNLVLKTAFKTGLMGYYNKDIGHAAFERFEVGGDGIANFNLQGKDIIALRGYDDSDVTRRTTTAGHPFFAKYTVELRYPLSLNPNSTIFALAFVEGGNSWSYFKDFNPYEVKRSAGLGLRVFLPMFGLLGFDYGVGFDKNIAIEQDGWWNYIGAKGRFSVILGLEPE